MAVRFINRDIKRIRQEPENITGVSLLPGKDDPFSWNVMILGPCNSEWDGGRFRLSVQLMPDHPFSPPHIKFTSRKIFHPNVYADGEICLDTLRENWTPALLLLQVIISIRSLLSDPNPDTPANPEAARLYVENRREYYKRVEENVEESLFEW